MNPHDLIEKHMNDDLSNDEVEALAVWLREDRAHVEEFVRATHAHAVLPDVLEEDILGIEEPAGGAPAAAPADIRPRRIRLTAPLAAAAGLLLTVLLGLYLGRLRSGSDTVARVHETSPRVTIERGGVEITAEAGAAILRGDRIRTDAAQRLSLVCEGNGARINLDGDTHVELWGGSDGGIVLTNGSFLAAVDGRRRGNPFVVGTPHAKVDVLGTTFRLSVSARATRLDMQEGVANLIHLASGAAREVYQWGYGFAPKERELLVFPPEGRARWVETVKRLQVDIPAVRGPGLAFDGALLWLASNDPPTLYGVDPETGDVARRLDLGGDVARIGNMVWDGRRLVVNGPLHSTRRGSEVCVIDRSSGAILEKLAVPRQLSYVSAFRSVTCAEGSLWAVLPQGGRIDRIAPDTGATEGSRYVYHPDITTLAFLRDAFWSTGERCLYQMDPSDMRVVDFYRNPDVYGIRDITGGGGSLLWMATANGELILLDVARISNEPAGD